MSDRRLRRLVLPSVIPLWPVVGHDALATRCANGCICTPSWALHP